MDANDKPALAPSDTERPHSRMDLACQECEERSYLRTLVAELLYKNQVLRFDLMQARNQVERIDRRPSSGY